MDNQPTPNTRNLLWTQTNPGTGAVHAPKYPGDAGYDLEVTERVSIQPRFQAAVPCGVSLALPDQVSAMVLPRSSSVRAGLLIYPTLIDSGYRGPMFVFIANLSDQTVVIEPGTRVAQLLPFANVSLSLQQVDQLPASDRGTNGFGSSGGGV